MKILVFSDLHLHNWSYGSTMVDGMNSRLRDQANVMEQIAMYPDLGHLDSIVFCGDLFHTHGKMDAAVLKVAYEGIKRILEESTVDMRFDFIVGNHDTSDKSMKTHSLHWVNAMDRSRVRVIDSEVHDPLLGISFLAYTEKKEVIEEFFKNAQPTCFMHQGLASVPMGSGFLINEILTLDMIPDHVKHVYLGHYHSHQRHGKSTIIGTPLQLNWADEGDIRGFLVIDTETGECEQIETDAPKFVTVDYNILSGEDVNNNFIKVINYDMSDIEEFRKAMFEDGARSVEFVSKTTSPGAILKPRVANGFHLPTIVKEYEESQGVTPERSKIGKEIMG